MSTNLVMRVCHHSIGGYMVATTSARAISKRQPVLSDGIVGTCTIQEVFVACMPRGPLMPSECGCTFIAALHIGKSCTPQRRYKSNDEAYTLGEKQSEQNPVLGTNGIVVASKVARIRVTTNEDILLIVLRLCARVCYVVLLCCVVRWWCLCLSLSLSLCVRVCVRARGYVQCGCVQ